MSNNWDWFVVAVERYIEPVLYKHQFVRLVGKAYEADENSNASDPEGRVLYYENESKEKLTVDVIVSHLHRGQLMRFYLLRIDTPAGHLKENMTMNTSDEFLDESDGWGFKYMEQIDQLMEEVAKGLEQYFDVLNT